MRRAYILESGLILLALASLWPVLLGHRARWAQTIWYTCWLVAVLGAMVWVAVRRLGRIRAAVEEAKRRRDEAERSGRPPC